MLIPFSKIVEILAKKGIKVGGILHIGAHECEELVDYKAQGVQEENIAWIEAQVELVEKMKEKGVKNIFSHCILDVETSLPFWKTNNGQSSSILEFNTHAKNYPNIHITGRDMVETITLKHFLDKNPAFAKFNFWNLDIQGVELRAMRSAGDYIDNVDAIYTEVNIEDVYEGCDQITEMTEFLEKKGFDLVEHYIYKELGWGDALYVRVRRA